VSDLSVTVRPRRRLRVVKDDPDNRVLECALTGRADLIVTGDKELLALGEYRGIRIIALPGYLAAGG
jgi:putative PIN family toxin of toxin-antitoxin system